MRKLKIDWNKVYSQDYIILRKSTHKIAREYRCSRNTVVGNFHKLGLKLRTAGEGRTGTKQSKRWIEKRMETIKNFLPEKRKQYKQRMSNASKGKKKSKEHCLNISKAHKGAKSSLWKGGISPINKRIRRSVEFRRWRKAVFARDNRTCQECGRKGGRLHPHHIKSFALYAKLRFAIDNGITLCVDCHKKTDNYGGRKVA